MPVPIIAGAVGSGALPVVGKIVKGIAKVGSKVGGFFKKLFGGKKRRRKERLAAKANRIEKASDEILARTLQKLDEKAQIGEAQAKVRLARIEKQLARQGVTFDPGTQEAKFDLGSIFGIPGQFKKQRNPGVFAPPREEDFEFQNVTAAAVPVPVMAGGLGNLFRQPIVLIVLGLITFLLLRNPRRRR